MPDLSLFAAVSSAPADSAGISSARHSWTRQELLRTTERLAAELDRRRPGACQPVVAAVSDIASTALLTLAADLAGLPVIHVEPAMPDPPGGLLIRDTPAGAGQADKDVAQLGGGLALSFELTPPAGLTGRSGPAPPSGLAAGAQVFLTSGSTGTPVGVVRPAQAVLADARRVAARLRYGPGTPVVASAPVFHLYGHTYALIAPLLSGAPVYHGGWHTLPSQMARAAVRTGARVMIAHPHQYRLLGRTDEAQAPDFGRLRIAVSAGAPLPAEIVRAIVSRYRFEMFNCYGSSEAGAVTLGPVRGSEPAGDVGTPLPGVVAEISGAGELLVRSDSLAAGYLSAGGLAPLPRTGGGYRTGDLAELADGRIRLRGRIATLINVAGKKVSPAEVEGVIAQHPAVRDVQVLAEQDPARGEVPVARVVAGPLTAAELLDWCRSRLAPSALPRRFDFCAELPRSATGKPILLARGEEHPTGGEPAWPPDPEGLSGHCSRHDD